MIEFRIRKAGYTSNMHLFLDEAVDEIYRYTKGYPRKITSLCHRALKELLLKNRYVVDARLIKELVGRDIKTGWYKVGTVTNRES